MHMDFTPKAPRCDEIGFDDFLKVDIRIGTILTAADFPKARKPSYQMTIDFGDVIGVKKSSAQITHHYAKDELIGRQVAAVVNFPVRQIANFFSEVLTLGFADNDGHIVLIETGQKVPNGSRMA